MKNDNLRKAIILGDAKKVASILSENKGLIGFIKKCRLNSRGKFGETPLHLAVIHNKTDIAELLISHGAEIDVEDGLGRMVYDIAKRKGNKRLLDVIEQRLIEYV